MVFAIAHKLVRMNMTDRHIFTRSVCCKVELNQRRETASLLKCNIDIEDFYLGKTKIEIAMTRRLFFIVWKSFQASLPVLSWHVCSVGENISLWGSEPPHSVVGSAGRQARVSDRCLNFHQWSLFGCFSHATKFCTTPTTECAEVSSLIH